AADTGPETLQGFKSQAEAPGNEVNGWPVHRGLGAYGTDYPKRAMVTWVGYGANLDVDALYPHATNDADGRPLDGAHRYVLHFDADRTPPVRGFWSLTMMNDRQLFADNRLDRYAIGDRSGMRTNPDGSLDIYVQHDNPGPDREDNWLPAPEGSFNVFLRLYWPDEAALGGAWTPPPLRRTSGTEHGNGPRADPRPRVPSRPRRRPARPPRARAARPTGSDRSDGPRSSGDRCSHHCGAPAQQRLHPAALRAERRAPGHGVPAVVAGQPDRGHRLRGAADRRPAARASQCALDRRRGGEAGHRPGAGGLRRPPAPPAGPSAPAAPLGRPHRRRLPGRGRRPGVDAATLGAGRRRRRHRCRRGPLHRRRLVRPGLLLPARHPQPHRHGGVRPPGARGRRRPPAGVARLDGPPSGIADRHALPAGRPVPGGPQHLRPGDVT